MKGCLAQEYSVMIVPYMSYRLGIGGVNQYVELCTSALFRRK